MSITRVNEFQAAENQADALFSFLTSLMPYITSSEGCLSCELLVKEDDNSQFVVIEKWVSKEAHMQSIQNFPQEEMQAAMPLFGAPPKGAYYTS